MVGVDIDFLREGGRDGMIDSAAVVGSGNAVMITAAAGELKELLVRTMIIF
jgi:hypothetical protein